LSDRVVNDNAVLLHHLQRDGEGKRWRVRKLVVGVGTSTPPMSVVDEGTSYLCVSAIPSSRTRYNSCFFVDRITMYIHLILQLNHASAVQHANT
jgi:hypothetical protein